VHKLIETIIAFIKRNRLAAVGGLIIVVFVVVGIFAPLISPYDPYEIDITNTLSKPSAEHWLGTDYSGRDILSRIIYGSRISLLISTLSVLVGTAIGVPCGMVSALIPKADNIIMRIMDAMLCFPGIITALAIITILGSGIGNLIIAIAIYQVPQFARLAYGLTLTIKEKDFVMAAVSTGARQYRIIAKHVLPNTLAPIIIQMSLLIPGAILTTAGLSFIGLGVNPPTAEWGSMLQESIKWFRLAPHTMVFPGISLMLVVFGFNTLGDGIRVFLDPKLKER
jgi:peptide/nickel transport system permease protein